MERWAWNVSDLAGNVRAAVVPRQAKVSRKLSASNPSAVELTLDATSLGVSELATTGRVVRGFRAPAGGGERVIRAAGKGSAVTATATTDAPTTITFTAGDGMYMLANRLRQSAVSYAGLTPEAILTGLIGDENARFTTGMTVEDVAQSGPPRDRSYETGKNVGEAIQQLAEIDGGFYYRVDPLDAGIAFSSLVILYPAPGQARGGVRFEWGEGTLGNLAGVTADVRPPTNVVIGFGAGEGEAQLLALKFDLASVVEFGLYDGSVSHPDVVIQETLDAHAQDAVVAQERRTFSVTCADPHEALPVPWDDFDVGDIVGLVLADAPPLDYVGPVLVTGFEVLIDADGIERLSSLTLQTAQELAST